MVFSLYFVSIVQCGGLIDSIREELIHDQVNGGRYRRARQQAKLRLGVVGRGGEGWAVAPSSN